jgi:RsmE family RNA methyltransferase
VNIILFDADETQQLLARGDARAVHLLDVLRCRAGDSFDAGIIDGPRGKATVLEVTELGLKLRFRWGDAPPPLPPIAVIAGMPRPQTARRLLQEATSLGVASMHFVPTERGEPGYGRSPLWSAGEWRRHLIAGAQQAFCTRLPMVRFNLSLEDTIAALPGGGTRLALDNYEATMALRSTPLAPPVALAIGPERGWSENERQTLRREGFALVHLGARVLRTETACVAALALIRAALDAECD